jgi:hypothetical protein
VKPGARQIGGGHGPNVVGMGSAVIRTVRMTSGSHVVFYFS